MILNKEPFKDVPDNLRYHYRFFLRKQKDPDSYSLPAKITDAVKRKFVDFIAGMYEQDQWRLNIKGTSVMHLWTENNDWEMVLKLSEQFPDHMAGMTRDVR